MEDLEEKIQLMKATLEYGLKQKKDKGVITSATASKIMWKFDNILVVKFRLGELDPAKIALTVNFDAGSLEFRPLNANDDNSPLQLATGYICGLP